MKCTETIFKKPSELTPLANNPRKITKEEFQRLVDSIRINGFWMHRPLALEEQDGKMVVLAGNQRLKAAKRLKLQEVPCVIYSDLEEDERLDIITRDNINNGEFDYGILSTDKTFQGMDFNFIGLQMPDDPDSEDRKPVKKRSKKAEQETSENEDPDGNPGDDDSDSEKEAFYRSMYKDVLYPSDNIMEIPTLMIDQQAGHLELPLNPWGANSRLRKDVATYHFYVDDYRFEALFKDPVKLVLSGCKAIVEPNCSCHDQTPIARGIQMIYKKRFLARYLQECGVKVYADLNVSRKFIEYNKMGIPKGYNAFFTRGLDGWMESLKSDLEVAQEISGKKQPNLIVYGGGDEIQAFCREHGLLYVTDFINDKKI